MSDHRDTPRVDGWAVMIEVNGETVLTIANNGLSGIPDITKYRDIVIHAAEHLRSFIGAPAARQSAEPFLQEQIDAMKLNDRRYRWLRENNEQHCDEQLPHVIQRVMNDWGSWYDKFLSPEELDAAIGAELAKVNP